MRSIKGMFVISEVKHGDKPDNNSGFDIFSETEQEFNKNVKDICKHILGNDFDQIIDAAHGHGSTDKLIEKFWACQHTDFEAINEIGFLFDDLQRGGNSGYLTDWLGGRRTPPAYLQRKYRAVSSKTAVLGLGIDDEYEPDATADDFEDL